MTIFSHLISFGDFTVEELAAMRDEELLTAVEIDVGISVPDPIAVDHSLPGSPLSDLDPMTFNYDSDETVTDPDLPTNNQSESDLDLTPLEMDNSTVRHYNISNERAVERELQEQDIFLDSTAAQRVDMVEGIDTPASENACGAITTARNLRERRQKMKMRRMVARPKRPQTQPHSMATRSKKQRTTPTAEFEPYEITYFEDFDDNTEPVIIPAAIAPDETITTSISLFLRVATESTKVSTATGLKFSAFAPVNDDEPIFITTR